MDGAPAMLSRPTDAPSAVGPASAIVAIQVFRQASRHRRNAKPTTIVSAVRIWLARISGRSDRHLLQAMADAVEALAEHCDQLAEHLSSQEAVTEEINASFGDEITLLRAQVQHLQGLLKPGKDA
jgi:hypothetical protein